MSGVAMKYALSITNALLAIGLTSVAVLGQATGMMTCESGDRTSWKTPEDLTNKVLNEGWKVRRIKEDGGCYELYGTTPKGERVEAYFHPMTLEKLLVHRRGEVLFRAKPKR